MDCINIKQNSSMSESYVEDDHTAFYDKIYNDYHGIHGYVATILCAFGLLANGCNILVLTRAEMFSTINMLLTSIALCDSILMISYIIYLAHFQLSSTYDCLTEKYSFGWAIFTVLHADISVASRACSLWLSVVMAALRSHILSRHQVLLLQSRYIANKRLGYKLILSTVGAVILMNIPVFINHTIEAFPIPPSRINNTHNGHHNCPKSAWIVVPPTVTLQYDCLMLKLGYWTNGLLLKLIPCILLTYYLIKLTHFVRMHMQHSQAKFGERETANSLKPTTFILVTILLVTLLCELPNALASLFSGVRSFAYGVMIYKSLGDIFDLLALVNGITSFILYCSMSQMFRETFLNFACDIRDYFLVRSTDYYRRWSVNMFGQSQSTAELQRQPSFGGGDGGGMGDGLITGDRLDDQEYGNNPSALPSRNGQVPFYERENILSPNRQIDDRYRLLESFDLLNSGETDHNQRAHQNFGPSPSSSSDKLINDDYHFSNKKKPKLNKKRQTDSALPMFDFTNLNLVHTRTSQLGSSLPSPPKINGNADDESEDQRIFGGSFSALSN